MTQIEKIKAEVDRLKHTGYAYNRGAYEAICTIEDFINSLPAEPVNEDLEEYEKEYFENWKDDIISVYDRHAGLVDGAWWQKNKILKALLDMEKDSVEVERKYGEGGRELYLKMLGVLRPFEED